LPTRTIEGGTDGYLTTDATTAKRRELAEMMRKDAEKLKNPSNPVPEMLRLAESLVYEYDSDTAEKAEALAGQYWTDLQQLPPDKLAAKKDEVRYLRDVCRYLARFGVIPDDAEPKVKIEEFVKEHHWDKK
jgi:hypothetical protein